MTSYDIIDAAQSGHTLVWRERAYLARMAAIPFLIKFACFLIVLLLGWERMFLRQALVMLPSYFADGWLLAHLVRFVFFDQRWPFRPTGKADSDLELLQERALGIMRGTLMFVVIKFLVAGITALLFQGNAAGIRMEEQEPTFGMFIGALGFFFVFFWAFRLMWLYIPASVNYPLRRFMRDLGGYSASWYLVGTWLLCFVPAFFFIGLILSALNNAVTPGQVGLDVMLLATLLQTIMDVATGILATASIAFGLKKYVLPKR